MRRMDNSIQIARFPNGKAIYVTLFSYFLQRKKMKSKQPHYSIDF